MATKKPIIASLLVIFVIGCATLLRLGHALDGFRVSSGYLDGLFLLLLIGVAIAGISWRPDVEDHVG